MIQTLFEGYFIGPSFTKHFLEPCLEERLYTVVVYYNIKSATSTLVLQLLQIKDTYIRFKISYGTCTLKP